MKLIDLIKQVDNGEILDLSIVDRQDGLVLSGENLKHLEAKIFECDEFKNVIRINFLENPTFLADKETGEPISVNRNFVGGDVKPQSVAEFNLEEDCVLHLNKMVDIFSIKLEKWYNVDSKIDKPGVWILPSKYNEETFLLRKEVRVIWEPDLLEDALRYSGGKETVKERLMRMFEQALDSAEPNTSCAYSLKIRFSSRSVSSIYDPASAEACEDVLEKIVLPKTDASDREAMQP